MIKIQDTRHSPQSYLDKNRAEQRYSKTSARLEKKLSPSQ
jgi:hypothetical protein